MSKYGFGALEIGEEMEIVGNPKRVASAASMWGTRYGVWLRVEKINDQRAKVTRTEQPPSRRPKTLHYPVELRIARLETAMDRTGKAVHRARQNAAEERHKKLSDALRFISLMLIELKAEIEEMRAERAGERT